MAMPAANDELRSHALEALLQQHPGALVAAIGEDGLFRDVELPAAGHRVAWGRSALEWVAPEDRTAIIDAWAQVRSDGASRAMVHLKTRPELQAQAYFLDVRAEYGVYAGVLVVPEGAEVGEVVVPPPTRPRFGSATKSSLSVFTSVDESFAGVVEMAVADIVDHRSLDFIHPDDQGRAIDSWMEMLGAPGHRVPLRVRHRTGGGEWRWVEIVNTNLLDDPDQGCVMTEMIDISDEMAMQEALQAREELFRRLAETVPVGLLHLDAGGAVVYTNRRLSATLGVASSASVDGWLATVSAGDRPRVGEALANALAGGGDIDLDVRVVRAERDVRRCTFAFRAVAGGGALVAVSDVTDSARLYEELERQATYDALTGCYNRASIVAALAAHIESGTETGVLYVDVDHFKDVNDIFGHGTGDELLRSTVERIHGVLRDGDRVGRLGGDEFLVVCPNVRDGQELDAIACRVTATLEDETVIGGHRLQIGASVGAVLAQGEPVDDVLARADRAMYTAKRGRREPTESANVPAAD